jgi:uncharacterized membrane protein
MGSTHTRLWPLAGLVFVVISIPFILEIVPPNQMSGSRADKTLSDERIWYAATRVMGIDLLIAGAMIEGTTMVTRVYLRDKKRLANRIHLAGFILSLGGAAVHSFWALSRL